MYEHICRGETQKEGLNFHSPYPKLYKLTIYIYDLLSSLLFAKYLHYFMILHRPMKQGSHIGSTHSLLRSALNHSPEMLQRLCEGKGTCGAVKTAVLSVCSIALGKEKGGLKFPLFCSLLNRLRLQVVSIFNALRPLKERQR